MGAGSNPHASSISATTTPEAITQIKKQRTCQILEQKNRMGKHGKLEELISECEAIQARLKKSFKTKKQSDQKAFCRPVFFNLFCITDHFMKQKNFGEHQTKFYNHNYDV